MKCTHRLICALAVLSPPRPSLLRSVSTVLCLREYAFIIARRVVACLRATSLVEEDDNLAGRPDVKMSGGFPKLQASKTERGINFRRVKV